MVFHAASKYVYDWLKKQSKVKEVSLTDWLLFDISEKLPYIQYQLFTQSEEKDTGADWEWWVLIKDAKNQVVSYHFLIQAKKLDAVKNNYGKINYKNGTQIQTLIDYGSANNMLALYAYYSTTQPDCTEQAANFSSRLKPLIDWCAPCTNGAFLSPAKTACSLMASASDKKLSAATLINHSLGLSVLDWHSKSEAYAYLEMLNTLYKGDFADGYQNRYNDYSGIDGIRYTGEMIPSYVYRVLEHQVLDMDELQEYHNYPLLSKVDGVGVVNLL